MPVRASTSTTVPRFAQVTSADQIGSFSKPRHERSPPPPKSGTLGGGDQHQPYSRQQQQQEVQNSVRHLSSSAFAGEGRGGERSFSGSASASAAGGMNPSNMGGGAPFLDLSTSSPAQRLFQPGGGGGSGGGGDAPGQVRNQSPRRKGNVAGTGFASVAPPPASIAWDD